MITKKPLNPFSKKFEKKLCRAVRFFKFKKPLHHVAGALFLCFRGGLKVILDIFEMSKIVFEI